MTGHDRILRASRVSVDQQSCGKPAALSTSVAFDRNGRHRQDGGIAS